MKQIAKLNAFKADPMNQFARDKPVQFFLITVAIIYSTFFIILDFFLVAIEAGELPNIERFKLTLKLILAAFFATIVIRQHWKKIEKDKANQKLEPTVKTPVD